MEQQLAGYDSTMETEIRRCEMELEFIDMNLTKSSEHIQDLMRYQSAVYSKYKKTHELRYKCQYNNMSQFINSKWKDMRDLELQYAEKERHINHMKLRCRIGEPRVIEYHQQNMDASSSSSSNGGSSSMDSSSSSFSSFSYSFDSNAATGPSSDEGRLMLSFGDSGMNSSDGENEAPPTSPVDEYDFQRELELLGLDLSDDEEEVLTFTM